MSNDWKRLPLGSFTERVRDINVDGRELEPLSVTKDHGVVLQSSRFNKRVATDLRKYQVVRRGDFVYDPMSLYYGSVGRLDVIDEGVTSPDYVVFKGDETVDPDFLLFLLRWPRSTAVFESHSERGNRAGKRRRLYWSGFQSIAVDLPPLPEQRKIAAILSSVDEAIEATQAVIDQVQVVKKGLMQELLTKGLPGRHKKFKPLAVEWRVGRVAQGGVRELPDSWELVTLTDVAKLESGHTPSRRRPDYWEGEIPWISLHDSKSLDGPEISQTAQTIGPLGLANSSARMLPRGTVVFSRTATVGKAAVMGREMSTSQDFANYVCGPRVHNRYLMHLFRHMQPEWNRLMAGSTHKTIYMPTFKELQVLLPPVEEQERIAEIADRFDRRMADDRQYREQLRRVKAGLMSVLLTGELRVQPEADASP